MQIGERLKQFARDFPGGIEALAKHTGWQPHRLYPILHDREEPSLALLQALARAGCDLNWLALGDEVPQQQTILTAEFEPGVSSLPDSSPSSQTPPQATEHTEARVPQANVLHLPTEPSANSGKTANADANPNSGDVEMLPIDALSPNAIRSLNINIKPAEKDE